MDNLQNTENFLEEEQTILVEEQNSERKRKKKKLTSAMALLFVVYLLVAVIVLIVLVIGVQMWIFAVILFAVGLTFAIFNVYFSKRHDEISNPKLKSIIGFLFNKHIFTYLTGFIVAFSGVFLAITFNSINTQNRERNMTIRLLEAAYEDIATAHRQVFTYRFLLERVGKYDDFEFPFVRPTLIHQLWDNEMVLTTISINTFVQVNIVLTYFEIFMFSYNRVPNNNERVRLLNIKLRDFQLLQRFIRNEIAYLNGNINLLTLINRHREAREWHIEIISSSKIVIG